MHSLITDDFLGDNWEFPALEVVIARNDLKIIYVGSGQIKLDASKNIIGTFLVTNLVNECPAEDYVTGDLINEDKLFYFQALTTNGSLYFSENVFPHVNQQDRYVHFKIIIDFRMLKSYFYTHFQYLEQTGSIFFWDKIRYHRILGKPKLTRLEKIYPNHKESQIFRLKVTLR